MATAVSCVILLTTAVETAAQEPARCRFVCAPTIEVAPTTTISNLLFTPRVAEVPDGAPQRLPRDVEFEIVVGADVPTTVPRLSFAFEVHWTPFSSTDANPFTGRTARELGVSGVRDNHLELESEINLALIEESRTGGWVAVHFDVLDNFGPAERPGDRSVYTHKLDFELDTSVSPFNWLPERNWLRSIDIDASLDYMATGLPKAGEELGGDMYLDDASRWSFAVAFVIPVAPR